MHIKNEWMTNDGRVIRYEDLDDGHLINIIKFLLKRREALNKAHDDMSHAADVMGFNESMVIYGSLTELSNKRSLISAQLKELRREARSRNFAYVP